jgi:hypothetical protein
MRLTVNAAICDTDIVISQTAVRLAGRNVLPEN